MAAGRWPTGNDVAAHGLAPSYEHMHIAGEVHITRCSPRDRDMPPRPQRREVGGRSSYGSHAGKALTWSHRSRKVLFNG